MIFMETYVVRVGKKNLNNHLSGDVTHFGSFDVIVFKAKLLFNYRIIFIVIEVVF